MTTTPIPPAVRRFIQTSIPSVPHMEALMLLSATSPARWRAADLARRLYVTPASALALLDDLAGAGIVEFDRAGQTCSYRAPPALADIVDQLGLLHRSHLVELTLLIHAPAHGQARQGDQSIRRREDG